MIITTAQEYALVNGDCCPCPIPTCESPRLSCESITINLDCGYQLPSFEGLSASDYCKRYAKKAVTYYTKFTQAGEFYGEGNEYYYHNKETNGITCEFSLSGALCNRVITSAYKDNEIKITNTGGSASDEDTLATDIYNFPNLSSTYTYTDNISSANNYTYNEIVNPDCDLWSDYPLDEDWTLAGTTFSLHQSFDYDAQTNRTTDISISYIDLMNSTWLNSKIASLNFEADKNGNGCASEVVTLSSCDNETISEATIARYKLAVPENYSSLSATRSTYEVQWQEVFVPALSSSSPSLVTNREWIWSGSMDEQFSPWYIIPVPSVTGSTVIANGLIKCYNSSRVGVKPTSFGTIIPL